MWRGGERGGVDTLVWSQASIPTGLSKCRRAALPQNLLACVHAIPAPLSVFHTRTYTHGTSRYIHTHIRKQKHINISFHSLVFEQTLPQWAIKVKKTCTFCRSAMPGRSRLRPSPEVQELKRGRVGKKKGEGGGGGGKQMGQKR